MAATFPSNTGHSNITTTKKYYLAVREEDIEKAGTFLNKLLMQSK
jgi:hypothetical protein